MIYSIAIGSGFVVATLAVVAGFTILCVKTQPEIPWMSVGAGGTIGIVAITALVVMALTLSHQ